MVNGFDFVIVTETWQYTDVEVAGYRCIIQDGTVSKSGGRNSGGIILLYKTILHDWISITKTSPNFLWFKISKSYAKTSVVFIFHRIIQIIITLNYLKNLKKIS